MKSLSFTKAYGDAEMLVNTTPMRNLCCKAPETSNSHLIKEVKPLKPTKQTKEQVLAQIKQDLPSAQDKLNIQKEVTK